MVRTFWPKTKRKLFSFPFFKRKHTFCLVTPSAHTLFHKLSAKSKTNSLFLPLRCSCLPCWPSGFPTSKLSTQPQSMSFTLQKHKHPKKRERTKIKFLRVKRCKGEGGLYTKDATFGLLKGSLLSTGKEQSESKNWQDPAKADDPTKEGN